LKEQERAERTVREAAASEERRKREEKRETLRELKSLISSHREAMEGRSDGRMALTTSKR
jgi:hypothetical protein